ncbi:putative gustatory receptor 59d [Eupeodes corollae]|uniref:putative gustatory receptor 59d n=1 Tax=Eupeodes corollae TaxID=290404 RepID=UPI00248F9F38|nr:putative gustatory receptor 59d [Eupeodes corollae]
MVYGLYLFKSMNFHLLSIVEEIEVLLENDNKSAVNEKTNFVCGEFLRIARIHSGVLKLMVEFKDCFQMSIMLILLEIIVSQFNYAFVLLVLSDDTFENAGFLFVCSSLALVTAFLNLWLLTRICGDIIDSCNEPADILGLLPQHVLVNDQLEKMIQSMSLMIKQEKMILSIYGLFDLEWATSFVATNTALDYLILLMQYDYYSFNFKYN